jgi:hypothetical protein
MRGPARVGIALGTLVAMGVGSGCRSHPPKVDCDKHLQPINAPAPKAKDESALNKGAAPSSEVSP